MTFQPRAVPVPACAPGTGAGLCWRCLRAMLRLRQRGQGTARRGGGVRDPREPGSLVLPCRCWRPGVGWRMLPALWMEPQFANAQPSPERWFNTRLPPPPTSGCPASSPLLLFLLLLLLRLLHPASPPSITSEQRAEHPRLRSPPAARAEPARLGAASPFPAIPSLLRSLGQGWDRGQGRTWQLLLGKWQHPSQVLASELPQLHTLLQL
ncbi:uncharacterized protein LOC141730660 isoform X2 [Zonotrichia albicollis]|uniref:uncharacterized protein LOC141730660 isoform X2 n=1 Tax=Zonotrichia albicollis TaxID=44394 RepID=UPI003D8123CB